MIEFWVTYLLIPDWEFSAWCYMVSSKIPRKQPPNEQARSVPKGPPAADSALPADTAPRLVTWQMDKNSVFDPQWIWNDRIPRGALTLLVPTPGGDATDVISDLAARVTAGVALPGDEEAWGGPGGQPPQGVVVVTAGGDPRSGIARQIALAGGRPDQLLVITGIAEPSDDENALPERSLSLTTDLPALRREIREWNRSRQGTAGGKRIGMLVIDALPFQVAKWREPELRTLFDQLNRLANELDLAVVSVTPLIGDPIRFAAGKITLPKALGSLAMVEMVRAIWQICPATDGIDRFLLLPLKSNSRAAPSAYQMREETVVWDDSSPSELARQVRLEKGNVDFDPRSPPSSNPSERPAVFTFSPSFSMKNNPAEFNSLTSGSAFSQERDPADPMRTRPSFDTDSANPIDETFTGRVPPAQRSADEIRQSAEWKRASRLERKRLLREAATR
ncbi:MAG: AAA family ATPase [Planctomycetota bacterium]|nr:AAA family ATPase [Planctomycetota bacterium]